MLKGISAYKYRVGLFKKTYTKTMAEFIDVDGSLLEGGGQILRISISLSAILGIPVRISKIRAGRSRPGLAAQHCKGIQLVAEMCQAKIKGAEIGSTEVEFAPKKIKGGHYFADPHTAGLVPLSPKSSSDDGIHEELRELLKNSRETYSDFSIFGNKPSICIQKVAFGEMELVQKTKDGHPKTGGGKIWQSTELKSISLLIQVALPCALMADGPVTMDLRGGTNADMAPQIDYMDKVFRRALKQFGADFELTIHRRGYFPKGGGQVTVNVNPVRSLRGVTLTEPGTVETIEGSSFVAGVLPINMAQQMAEGAKQTLRAATVTCYREDGRTAVGNCNGMLLTCTTSTGNVLGSDALGKRGSDPRQLGADAATHLKKAIDDGACLDQHCQDQVILFMALAEGKSSVTVGEVTLHTNTAIHIAELLAKVKFVIHPNGSQNTIECTGLGLINNHLPT